VGAGWLAVVGVLSSTRITAQFMVAKNDLIEAAYVVAAGSFMLSGRGRGARIAAIFFGCAAATKYTGLVSLATGIGWLIFSLPKKQWAEMVCFGILPFGPWAVKSWLFTGDPAWPLLAAWLPGALWDPATAGAIHAMRGGSLVSDLLAMGPKHFESLVLYAPAVAVMSPMAALAFRSSERRVRQLAAYTVVTAIAMYCALPWQAMRYAIPFHILWTGLVSAGTFRVVAAWPRTQRLAGAWGLAILVLVATPRLLAERADIGARCTYLLGGYTKQELYRARMTSMADAHDALKGLADVRRVMYAGELRYLHMPGQHLGDRGPGQGLIWMASKESQTPGEIVKKFRQVNCRHILLNFVTEAYPHIGASSFHWDDRMLALWRTFTGRYLKLMAVPQNVDNHNGGFAIYELREKPLSRDPLWLPYMPGIEGLLIEVSQFGQSGNLSGWITAARQIYRRVPDVDLIRDQLALGLRLQGSWGEAWRLYKVGIDHGTLTGTNLFDAAVCAASLGQFAAAEKLLHRCAEVTPQLRPQVEIALADLAQRYR
jgi:hypothetical protein